MKRAKEDVAILLNDVWHSAVIEYEFGMCKLEMMIEGETKKRMELDEKVNVLVAKLQKC